MTISCRLMAWLGPPLLVVCTTIVGCQPVLRSRDVLQSLAHADRNTPASGLDDSATLSSIDADSQKLKRLLENHEHTTAAPRSELEARRLAYGTARLSSPSASPTETPSGEDAGPSVRGADQPDAPAGREVSENEPSPVARDASTRRGPDSAKMPVLATSQTAEKTAELERKMNRILIELASMEVALEDSLDPRPLAETRADVAELNRKIDQILFALAHQTPPLGQLDTAGRVGASAGVLPETAVPEVVREPTETAASEAATLEWETHPDATRVPDSSGPDAAPHRLLTEEMHATVALEQTVGAEDGPVQTGPDVVENLEVLDEKLNQVLMELSRREARRAARQDSEPVSAEWAAAPSSAPRQRGNEIDATVDTETEDGAWESGSIP